MAWCLKPVSLNEQYTYIYIYIYIHMDLLGETCREFTLVRTLHFLVSSWRFARLKNVLVLKFCWNHFLAMPIDFGSCSLHSVCSRLFGVCPHVCDALGRILFGTAIILQQLLFLDAYMYASDGSCYQGGVPLRVSLYKKWHGQNGGFFVWASSK